MSGAVIETFPRDHAGVVSVGFDDRVRCDLHVHSWHSGPVNLPVLRHLGRDSYSDPREVYDRARGRGLDLVTLTDHDTIDGALAIADRPGTFVSEEVTVVVPGGRRVHVNVYGIDERQHARIASLRHDAEALFAYLEEQRLAAALNHPFSSLTGRRRTGDLLWVFDELRLVEVRNGSMPAVVNRSATAAAAALGRGGVGGSDAHALAGVGRAFTRVPGARNREEFLEGLRAGRGIPEGASGGVLHLTAEIAGVLLAGYSEAARRGLRGLGFRRAAALLALAPCAVLIPAFAAAQHAREAVFARRHFRRLQQRCAVRRVDWESALSAPPR